VANYRVRVYLRVYFTFLFMPGGNQEKYNEEERGKGASDLILQDMDSCVYESLF
jgi:hypothetical protein